MSVLSFQGYWWWWRPLLWERWKTSKSRCWSTAMHVCPGGSESALRHPCYIWHLHLLSSFHEQFFTELPSAPGIPDYTLCLTEHCSPDSYLYVGSRLQWWAKNSALLFLYLILWKYITKSIHTLKHSLGVSCKMNFTLRHYVMLPLMFMHMFIKYQTLATDKFWAWHMWCKFLFVYCEFKNQAFWEPVCCISTGVLSSYIPVYFFYLWFTSNFISHCKKIGPIHVKSFIFLGKKNYDTCIEKNNKKDGQTDGGTDRIVIPKYQSAL